MDLNAFSGQFADLLVRLEVQRVCSMEQWRHTLEASHLLDVAQLLLGPRLRLCTKRTFGHAVQHVEIGVRHLMVDGRHVGLAAQLKQRAPIGKHLQLPTRVALYRWRHLSRYAHLLQLSAQIVEALFRRAKVGLRTQNLVTNFIDKPTQISYVGFGWIYASNAYVKTICHAIVIASCVGTKLPISSPPHHLPPQ